MAFLSFFWWTVRPRGTHLAHTPRISEVTAYFTNTPFVDWNTELRLSGCDASILANDVICTLQCLRANSCDRTARARQNMQLWFFCFRSRHCFLPATSSATLDRGTSINISVTFLVVSHWFLFGNKELYHSKLFITDIIDWLHFEALLQWCYLSEVFTTSYITAGSFEFVLPIFSHS
jgi:hypothetical protein